MVLAARFSIYLSIYPSVSFYLSHRRARRAGLDGVGAPGLNQDPIRTSAVRPVFSRPLVSFATSAPDEFATYTARAGL